MNPAFFFLMISILLCSCNHREKGIKELIATDLAFSKLSEEIGNHEAFLSYVDDSGVLLRDNSYPIAGKEKLKELFSQSSDTGYILTWKPDFADISSSYDMGYTYGTYHLTSRDTILKGCYVTIWKKGKNGRWKFVLDGGTQGLENK